jgi:hypothetical protein
MTDEEGDDAWTEVRYNLRNAIFGGKPKKVLHVG